MSSPPLTKREYAYFSVTGAGSSEVITERLGWRPSQAWSEADPRPRGGVYPTMNWKLESGHPDTEPLERHVESLLLVLAAKAADIRELSLDYDLTLQCVGYYPSSGHGAHLNRETIRQASYLGLSIDLDFYYVDDHGHDG